MGRNSKEHIELKTKTIYQYLVERDSCSKRLLAVQKMTNSLLKCRSTNGERKKKYRSELDNAHRVLCSAAADLIESRERILELEEEATHARAKKAQILDDNVALSWKLRELEDMKRQSDRQKEYRLRTEEDCGKFYRENEKLKDELVAAKNKRTQLAEKNKSLEEELAKVKAKLKATVKSGPASSESS